MRLKLSGSKIFNINLAMCVALTLLALVILALVPNTAHAIQTGEYVANVIAKISDRLSSIEKSIPNIAQRLFYIIFACQLAWSVGQLMLSENMTISAFFITLVRQILAAMFFYWLLIDQTVLQTVFDSFWRIGGEFKLSPGKMLTLLDNCCAQIMNTIGEKTAWREQGICLYLSGFTACVAMYVGIGSSIIYMVIIIIENYVLGSVCFLFLGLGASEYTREYAKGYIKALVQVVFKLFLVSVVLNVGLDYFYETFKDLKFLDDGGIIRVCLQLVAISVLYAMLVKIIPSVTDALFKSVSLNSTGFLRDLLAVLSRPVNVTVQNADYVNPVDAASNAYMSPEENTLPRQTELASEAYNSTPQRNTLE